MKGISTGPGFDRRLSVAPMMDRTDRHDRYFLRLISPSACLYSEMITTGALLHGDRERFLKFDPAEKPVALQLGGSEPKELAKCAEMAASYGYDEINLNIGCPSDRVQRGRFGVCLMKEPTLVARCVQAMRSAVDLPVTVKTRIGVDELDSWEFFRDFVDIVAEEGCRVFIVHARKAWLKGLSPRQNREIPPLCYETVYRLKKERPELTVIINGGITEAAEIGNHLAQVDGVMIGRSAYENPWLLAEIEARVLGTGVKASRQEVLDRYIAYMDREHEAGVPLHAMARHTLGLFRGLPGARAWRRHVTEGVRRPGAKKRNPALVRISGDRLIVNFLPRQAQMPGAIHELLPRWDQRDFGHR